ncbi:hypothetical protein L9F63_014554, partial [Diploptera punctata]
GSSLETARLGRTLDCETALLVARLCPVKLLGWSAPRLMLVGETCSTGRTGSTVKTASTGRTRDEGSYVKLPSTGTKLRLVKLLD